MNVLFPSPSLFPPLSFPVAIIEPTTTSAVSSPGQYMSPCCTPNQQRGPLPHTNLNQNPLLHFGLFQLAGWNDFWVYSLIVCPLFLILLFFFFLQFWVGFHSLSTYTSCSLCHCTPCTLPFIKSHFCHNPTSPMEQTTVVIKVAVSYASGSDAFHNADGFFFFFFSF